MRFSTSDIVALLRPTPCNLRVYLRQQGIPDSEFRAFDLVLQELGERHERDHLVSLGTYSDLSRVPPDQLPQRTAEAIRDRVPVVYEGELAAGTALNGVPVTIVGRPDLLILEGEGYLIRDSKLSRQVDEHRHPEITLQLQLYGWLYAHPRTHLTLRVEDAMHKGCGFVVASSIRRRWPASN